MSALSAEAFSRSHFVDRVNEGFELAVAGLSQAILAIQRRNPRWVGGGPMRTAVPEWGSPLSGASRCTQESLLSLRVYRLSYS